MSYDFSLVDRSGSTVILRRPHYEQGGTYAVNGTREAWFNITFNYAPIFCKVFDANLGIKVLQGKTAALSIPVLERALDKLDPTDNDGPGEKELEEELKKIIGSLEEAVGTAKERRTKKLPESPRELELLLDNLFTKVKQIDENKAGGEARFIKMMLGIYENNARTLARRYFSVDPVTRKTVSNYWDCNEYNAYKAINSLLNLAKAAPPDSVWQIDY
ncbi:MAG: hypothetical protein Q4D58_03950 [Synergistaceae bacterium]|nr:hypothetical protein [Synergistaceae bacterium]